MTCQKCGSELQPGMYYCFECDTNNESYIDGGSSYEYREGRSGKIGRILVVVGITIALVLGTYFGYDMIFTPSIGGTVFEIEDIDIDMDSLKKRYEDTMTDEEISELAADIKEDVKDAEMQIEFFEDGDVELRDNNYETESKYSQSGKRIDVDWLEDAGYFEISGSKLIYNVNEDGIKGSYTMKQVEGNPPYLWRNVAMIAELVLCIILVIVFMCRSTGTVEYVSPVSSYGADDYDYNMGKTVSITSDYYKSPPSSNPGPGVYPNPPPVTYPESRPVSPTSPMHNPGTGSVGIINTTPKYPSSTGYMSDYRGGSIPEPAKPSAPKTDGNNWFSSGGDL